MDMARAAACTDAHGGALRRNRELAMDEHPGRGSKIVKPGVTVARVFPRYLGIGW